MVVEESGEDEAQHQEKECGHHVNLETADTPGQPEVQPEEESVDTLQVHCKSLNIKIDSNCVLEERQTTSKKDNFGTEKCIAVNSVVNMSDFLSVFPCVLSKYLKSGFVFCDKFGAMSLTPRHMLSLIRYLWMACRGLAKPQCLVFFAVLFGTVVGPSDGGTLVTSKQVLPPECYDWFHGKEDCPIKADWDPSWNNQWGTLNQTCCAGFPGTVLHCQRNGTANFPACLPDQIVISGHTGVLSKDEEGNPVFKIVSCDPAVRYEPFNRVSSNVTFPYCSMPKYFCTGEGEELLCQSGADSDNLCTCKEGYQLIGDGCHGGYFTRNQDGCQCSLLPCPVGQVPVRTALRSGTCADLRKNGFDVHFWCADASSVSVPPSGAGQSTTPLPKTTENSTVPFQEIQDDISRIVFSLFWWFVVPFHVVFLIVLGVLVYIARCL